MKALYMKNRQNNVSTGIPAIFSVSFELITLPAEQSLNLSAERTLKNRK
ncbi:hypothetical protein [Niabella beijingensis]|nr:hypothetical protein [Niabella beijingensis]MBZ4188167.1 hypothetical protein [Niabella beijingensis]